MKIEFETVGLNGLGSTSRFPLHLRVEVRRLTWSDFGLAVGNVARRIAKRVQILARTHVLVDGANAHVRYRLVLELLQRAKFRGSCDCSQLVQVGTSRI